MTVTTMNIFFALLTVAALGIALFGAVVPALGRWSPAGRRLSDRLRVSVQDNGLWLAWAIAAVATAGSLYYSEIAGFTPCKLCWYQRIAMYPLAVILGVAAFWHDHRVRRYVLPIVSIGAAISVYHYLIERFPSWAGDGSCDPTAPCTTVWVWQFHFISIPFMAFSGFAAIAALLWLMPHHSEGGQR